MKKLLTVFGAIASLTAVFWCARLMFAQTEYEVLTPEDIRPVHAGFPARGDSSAPVSVTVYFDYECPYTKNMLKSFDSIMAQYPKEDIFYTRKPRALYKKQYLREKVLAAYVAQRRGLFEPMHTFLLSLPRTTKENSEEILSRIEKEIRRVVDAPEEFLHEIRSQKNKRKADECRDESRRYGITAVPAVIVNGRVLSGAYAIMTFEKTIEKELSKSRSEKNDSTE